MTRSPITSILLLISLVFAQGFSAAHDVEHLLNADGDEPCVQVCHTTVYQFGPASQAALPAAETARSCPGVSFQAAVIGHQHCGYSPRAPPLSL